MRTNIRRILAIMGVAAPILIATNAGATTFPNCQSCTPVISPSNGKIQHPEIAYTFWQSAANPVWTNGTASPHTYNQEVGFMLSLASNSQYWAKIAAPGFVAPPRVAPFANIYTGTVNDDTPDSPVNCSGTPQQPACTFSEWDVATLINDRIANGLLPTPQASDTSVYVVMVPGTEGFCGEGSGGQVNNLPKNPQFDCNFTAVYNGTKYIGIFGSDYPGLSHEIVESIASYEGLNVTNSSSCKSAQIADLCGCHTGETVNSFTVAPYWSTTDGECVLPESWGNLWVDTTGANWTKPPGAFHMRQASGGAGGVVATDSGENGNLGNTVHYYNGSSWTQFGGGGSEFAAGGGIIAAVNMNASDVNYYTISSGVWTNNIGTPNGLPATGVTVTSTGIIVATDPTASPWYFNPSHPGWNKIAGPGDQVVAGAGAEVFALNPAHNDFFYWTGPGAGFLPTIASYSTTELMANPDASLLSWTTPGALWGPSNPPTGIQGAVPGNSNFKYAWFDFAGSIWAQNSSGIIYNTQGVGGLLISGNNLYAAGCEAGVAPCVFLN